MAEESMVPGRSPYDVAVERAAQPAADQTSQAGDGLDDLTKDELLQEAENRGVEVKTSSTKAEILEALRS